VTTLKLPEKTYFSLDEIADRWGCNVDLLEHYISEGWLREGAFGEEILANHFVTLSELTDNAIKERVELEILTGSYEFSRDEEDCVRSLDDGSTQLFYLNVKNYQIDLMRPDLGVQCSEMETFEGDPIYLLDSDRRPTHIPTQLLKTVISREERDRFEREHSINVDSTTESTGYSTPHLEVLREAINHFFNPRRDPDPKRDEVVTWINDRLKERGQGDSDRIASAIFTIIKPEDHNPRRRRG